MERSTMPKRLTERGIAVQAKTVRISNKGVARLSPDLVLARRFTCMTARTYSKAGKTKKKIVSLTPSVRGDLKVWFCSRRAKSGLISLARALSHLGIPKAKQNGVYPASIRKTGRMQSVIIDLSRNAKG